MKYYSINNYTILFLSILFGILVQLGFYGFNIDYYAEYYKSNLYYHLIFDRLGALLATLTIYNFHIGLFLTSFTLAYSSGLIILKCFEYYFIKTKNNLTSTNIKYFFLIFYIIFITTLHTHPIIMSTSGAMRQGWSMCFLFFSLYTILDKKFILSFTFIFISIFMHKSGLINFIYFLAMFFSIFIVDKFRQKNTLLFFLSVAFTLTAFGLYIFIKDNSFYIGTGLVKLQDSTRVVYGDFRFLWFLVNFSYIILFFFYSYKSKLKNTLKYPAIFLLFASLGNIVVLYNGLNFQYERLNMMIGILYIHIISLMFRRHYLILIFMLTFIYLFMTIYQGMYSIGLV